MVDLFPLAADYFDAAAQWAFGISLLVAGAAFVVMRLYTRTIARESRRSAAPVESELFARSSSEPSSSQAGPLQLRTETLDSDASPAPQSVTFQHAHGAFRRGAWCYVLAGTVHAASSTARLWATMDQRSPNARGDSGHLRLIEFHGGYARAVRRLLAIGDEAMLKDPGPAYTMSGA